MTVSHVLDASALLAMTFEEPGAELVRSLMDGSAVGAVQVGEALSKMIKKGFSLDEARAAVCRLQMLVFPFDADLALDGADLAHYGWTHGLSFGDRACLALARKLGVPAVTADARWVIPGLPVEVRLIR